MKCPLCGVDPQRQLVAYSLKSITVGGRYMDSVSCGACGGWIGTVPSVAGGAFSGAMRAWAAACAQHAQLATTVH